MGLFGTETGAKSEKLENEITILKMRIKGQEMELVDLKEKNSLLEERLLSVIRQLDEAELELLKPKIPLPDYRSMMRETKQAISDWFRVY